MKIANINTNNDGCKHLWKENKNECTAFGYNCDSIEDCYYKRLQKIKEFATYCKEVENCLCSSDCKYWNDCDSGMGYILKIIGGDSKQNE